MIIGGSADPVSVSTWGRRWKFPLYLVGFPAYFKTVNFFSVGIAAGYGLNDTGVGV
jgi:hypothetical protein